MTFIFLVLQVAVHRAIQCMSQAELLVGQLLLSRFGRIVLLNLLQYLTSIDFHDLHALSTWRRIFSYVLKCLYSLIVYNVIDYTK